MLPALDDQSCDDDEDEEERSSEEVRTSGDGSREQAESEELHADTEAILGLEQAHGQVSRMLGAMCDAVVYLDSSLCISGGPENGVSKLNSLLLLPLNSIFKRPFVDYIGAQDRDSARSADPVHLPYHYRCSGSSFAPM